MRWWRAPDDQRLAGGHAGRDHGRRQGHDQLRRRLRHHAQGERAVHRQARRVRGADRRKSSRSDRRKVRSAAVRRQRPPPGRGGRSDWRDRPVLHRGWRRRHGHLRLRGVEEISPSARTDRHRHARPSTRKWSPRAPRSFSCSSLFLLLAPLYKASNRPLPLLLLELSAIGFLVALVRHGVAARGARRAAASADDRHRSSARLPAACSSFRCRISSGARCPGMPNTRSCWTDSPARRPPMRSARSRWCRRPPKRAGSRCCRRWPACFAVQWLVPGHVVRLLLAMAIMSGRRGAPRPAAGARRPRFGVLRAERRRPRHGHRHVRQPQSLRRDAGDDAAGHRRPAGLHHSLRTAPAASAGLRVRSGCAVAARDRVHFAPR